MIYFVTVNYYSSDLISQLLESLPKTNEVPYKFLIVNNSHEDKAINQLETDSISIIQSEHNLGFGRACNLGLNWIYSQNPKAIVWIINPDTYVVENAIKKVTDLFENYSEISIAGTIIYTKDDNVWFGGGRFIRETGAIISQEILKNNIDLEYFPSEWVSGCSLIINLQKFQECPQFDPAYFLYYEDFDFCRRYADSGHLIVVTPQISVVHKPSSITNKNLFNKFKHSTYSYLLTIEKYTNSLILLVRFIRIILYALILLPVKPQIAVGKLYGVLLYLQHRI